MDPDPAIAAAAAAAAVETLSLTPSAPSDLPFESDSLHDLAARGQWRSVLDKVSRARSLSLLPLPHDHLVYLAYNALALYKLRRFSDAAAELNTLSPFSHPRYLYSSYPDTYPDRHGSMLPFALRFLHADLPQRLGDRPLSLDRLYSLLEFVRSHILSADNASQWRRRESFLISHIFCNHFANREFDVAIALIGDLLAADPSDPVLLSRLGYIQMQIGDLDSAKASFARVESLCSGKGLQYENLVGRNRALVCVVAKDFVAAAREYEECIERDPADVVALNNKALCLMYSRDLSDSIKLLEGALERVPTAAVNETLVVNLCSMYELAYVNHGEIKKSLSNWIARVAPDDFDPSCTRI